MSAQQTKPVLFLYKDGSQQLSDTAQPLQQLASWRNAESSSIKVFDGNGKEYFSSPASPLTRFVAGGALGKQSVVIYNTKSQPTDSLFFYLDAKTDINDGGYYKNMFDLFYKGMFADVKEGTFSIEWDGKTYNVFVPWVLDNFQTMKGLKYFLPNGKELIDIMRQSQREDGMIYSFIQYHGKCRLFFNTR